MEIAMASKEAGRRYGIRGPRTYISGSSSLSTSASRPLACRSRIASVTAGCAPGFARAGVLCFGITGRVMVCCALDGICVGWEAEEVSGCWWW